MNQAVVDAIRNRRSYRSYRDKEVPAETLKAIAEIAVQAPSANNKQPWKLIVVTDKKWLAEFDAEGVRNALIVRPDFDPNAKILKGAPSAIFVCADESNDWSQADCGMLTQNLCLAAEAYGLGTCIIGMIRFTLEGENGKKYLDEIGAGEGWKPLYAVVIGYPDVERPDARERDLTKILFN